MATSHGSDPRLGFVGLGTMGGAMAGRLLAAGFDLVIHDVDPGAAAPLVERGARFAQTAAALAAEADVVLLSLPGPPEVETVIAGEGGLLRGAREGAVIVDLSTNSLAGVRSLAARCEERGIGFLDAPVSGGVKGSTEGTLVLMVGGRAEVLERARPALEPLSRSIRHFGASGAGTTAKLVHNQLYLCGEVLFFEGLVLAAKAGIDPEALVDLLKSTGAGGVHANLADRVLRREFDDTTFALALAEKDVALVLEAGRSLSVPMPATAAAHELYVEGRAAGLDAKNFWAAFELVERRADTRLPPVESAPG